MKKIMILFILVSYTLMADYSLELKKDNLIWEKEIDTGKIVYNSTLWTLLTAAVLSNDMDERRGAALTSLTGIGAYIKYSLAANDDKYQKRDVYIMNDIFFATYIYSNSIYNRLIEDGDTVFKLATVTSYGAYTFSKSLIRKYDLNIASTSFGLRSQIMSRLFMNSLSELDMIPSEGEEYISLVTDPLIFYNTAKMVQKKRVSRNSMAMLNTYSDGLAMLGYSLLKDEDLSTLSSVISAQIPYFYMSKFDNEITFKEGDYYKIKAGEILGGIAGSSLAVILGADDEQIGQASTGLGIIAMNRLTKYMLEEREIKERKSYNNEEINFEINPTALIFPALKVRGGGGKLFVYRF